MRTLSLAAAALAALIVVPASAQQAVPTWHDAMPTAQWQGAQAWNGQGMAPPPHAHDHRGSRWGGRTNGRWSGGGNAPGGWGAYHRPVRGWTLPRYWIAPSFYIGDYASYGLASPPNGYYWSRYYDDAVLTDDYGRVQDSVSGIDWDRAGDGYAYDGGPGQGGYGDGPGAGYQRPEPGYAPAYAPDRGYDDCGPGRYRRDHGGGVAGAVIGGVAGGFAGNAIAGRHDKTLGSVAGAAVGAGAGYAIGHSGDRGHYEADCRGADYAPPPPPPGPVPAPGGWRGAPPPIAYQTFPNGTQVWSSTTYSGDGRGYIRGNFWYPPAVTTTVTVSTQPVVTTTTEYVTGKTYRPARKVWHRKVWRKPRRCTCTCTTTCR